MPSFFLVSGDGDGLAIGRRIVDEGHQVTAYIKNPKARGDFDGLLNKSDKLVVSPQYTAYIFDSTGGGKTAERIQAQGIPVIGAGMFAQQLEMDRHLAADLARDAGVKVPPSQHFTDWEAGKQYCQAKGDRMVYKSDGNQSISYVASCPDDMCEFITAQEKEGDKPDYELQDFVKGLEISTEVWIDGSGYATPFNHTFEKKQLMNDDIGPSSGCSGNVVWACTETYCRICDEGVKRFIPTLLHHGYRGPFDFNTIVNDEGVWWLENTPRFGFDAFPALMEMLTEGVGDLLLKYARGERVAKFPIREKGFGAGLRVTIPPYPFEKDHEVLAPKGVPIRELVRADRTHAYFYNVFFDPKTEQLRSSGAFGAIACFTGFGDSIFDAMQKCVEMAQRVDIRDKQFRTDLGGIFEQSYMRFKQIVGAEKLTAVAAIG